MFLFSTPASPDVKPSESTASSPVVDAIRQAAKRTGAVFSNYLINTSKKESGLNAAAKSPLSSASGPFQFIEQTWYHLVRDHGVALGMPEYAQAISSGSGGRLTVADEGLKRDILALRHDPKTAAEMAVVFTNANKTALAAAIGREPTEGELYAAHVLGPKGGASLILSAKSTPMEAAATHFPEAAASNRGIFFDRSGRARGLGEVYALLTQPPAASSSSTVPNTAEASLPVVYSQAAGPVLFSLFRTEGQRGPISEAVAKLWSGTPATGVRVASTEPFYPRLKPELTGTVQKAKVERVPSEKSPARGVRASAKPLDLSQFLQVRTRP